MSGGRFLVGLKDVTHSEKIMKLKSLLKGDINAPTEDIFLKKNEEEKLQNFLFGITSENLIKETTTLSDDTREVGIYISGYIANKIKDRSEDCFIEYAVGEIKEGDADSAYLKTLTNMVDSYQSVSCLNHKRKIQLFVNQVISHIFLNNKSWLSIDYVSVDTIKSFKKRQREK